MVAALCGKSSLLPPGSAPKQVSSSVPLNAYYTWVDLPS